MTEATYFATPALFRKWLERNHAKATELIVGYHKKETGVPSLTWPESVDEALSYGWIDGVRRRVDEDRYCIRFTPRKKGSHWSNVNVGRVEVLRQEGRMTPAGEAAFAQRKEENTGKASFEQGDLQLSTAQIKQLKGSKSAWAFWEAQPASYKKAVVWWVVSAKKEETQAKRMEQLIADCEAGKRIKQFVSPAKRT
jgi:uncharacterized protein YdeI (YjbR/CyaY-like superfamily)